MNVVAKNEAPKRVRAGTKSKRAPSIYAALHTTQLSRCLAHGLLFARGGSSLEPCAAPVPVEVLGRARQGLDYGSVVLVELDPARAGLDLAAGDAATLIAKHGEVPLAWVARVVFGSAAERDEFLARAGTYEDVPVSVLEYEVDSSLFGSGGLLDALDPPRDAELEGAAVVQHGVAIGRLSGTIAAVLACARWDATTAGQLDDLCGAFNAASIDASPLSLIRELARAVDDDTASEHGVAIVGVAASMLSTAGTNSGLDVDRFLSELCREAVLQGADAELVTVFEKRAASVLSGATELRDDAFSDAHGKVALRALLLFMLNPEIEALRKIRARMGNIGPGVCILACALAGCHGGIARCDVSTKAPDRAVFLGTTLLAWRIHVGQRPALENVAGWTRTGTFESSVGVGGFRMAAATLPAPARLHTLKTALAGMGIESTFDTGNGALSWSDAAADGQQFFAHASRTPSLPSTDSIDICTHVDQDALAKGVARAWTDACLTTRESGVFARQFARGKTKGLELRVACVATGLSPLVIRAATQLLIEQAKPIQRTSPVIDPAA